MAKSLLKDFKIGSDIIDRVGGDSPVPDGPFNSVETLVSAESPPVGPPSESEHLPEPPGAPAQNEDSMQVHRDGLHQVFTLGGTTYRIGGVKPLFVTSLRVNLRVNFEGSSYYDSLDLYSAKARSSFAAALNRQWGAEPSRVEKDLVLILEDLERQRDSQLQAANQKPEIKMSEAEKAAGLELLRDPHLMDRIVSDLSALGYVGEDLNKQLLYLCASSRKLDDPISVMILSQSASGKSFLVESVKKLIPPEDVVAVTSLSDQALNYIDDLVHKFLVLGESVHGEVVEHQIREMLSGKELSRLVTVKDSESGKMQSRIMRTPVIVASVLSGTNHAVNPENASRYFVVNTDESKGQTERIHAHQRRKYSLERLSEGPGEKSRIISTHQAAQRLLVKRPIVNRFAPLLDFPTSLMRLRRDHDRFLDLIACVAFLRQFQKEIQVQGGVEYIECDLSDYAIAYKIMVEQVLGATVRELPKGAVAVYEEIRQWVKDQAKKQNLGSEEISFTQRQVREATGLAHTWVKHNLRQLVDYEYLVLAAGGRERTKAFYRLREDAGIAGADLSMIPSPEQMKARLAGGRS